jgi:hypothetical protein
MHPEVGYRVARGDAGSEIIDTVGLVGVVLAKPDLLVAW